MKKITVLLLCLALLLSLAACGEREPQAAAEMTETHEMQTIGTQAPETTVPETEPANVRNPFSEERYVEVVKSKTRKCDGVVQNATPGHRSVLEQSDGSEAVYYSDGLWSYECDGKEGMGRGDNVWISFAYLPGCDFEKLLAEDIQLYTQQELEQYEFTRGDNWYQMKCHRSLGDGISVCIDDIQISIYGPSANYDYFNTVIDELTGDRDYQESN